MPVNMTALIIIDRVKVKYYILSDRTCKGTAGLAL